MRGKQNIAIIGFTKVGDVFGGFFSVAVTAQNEWIDDLNIFAFSFESHGRCMTPQRVVGRNGLKMKANLKFYKNSNRFVAFCVGDDFVGAFFLLGDEKSHSYCENMSWGFEGIQDTTLTGKNGHYWYSLLQSDFYQKFYKLDMVF